MNEELLPFTLPEKEETFIKVIGVGGGGGNAINYMYNQGICNVDFIVCNTDVQDLKKSPVATKIALGSELTGGHGAGSDAETGEKAARESTNAIHEALDDGTRMVFITAGMGGGTGTGAAPVIAEVAKGLGILTVGVVTLPFKYEGNSRLQQAIRGIETLSQHVDSLLIINNQTLFELYGKLPITETYSKADSILCIAVKGTVEIMTKPGLQNVDFNDAKKVLQNSGIAVMGTGIASGEDRAYVAATSAIENPLLNKVDIRGAKNALVNISGNKSLLSEEVESVLELIRERANTDVDLKFGIVIDENLGDSLQVTIVATGFDAEDIPDFRNFKIKPSSPAGSQPSNEPIVIDFISDVRDKEDLSDFHLPPSQRKPIEYNPNAQHSAQAQEKTNNASAASTTEPITITLLNPDNQFAHKAAQAQMQNSAPQPFNYASVRGGDISAYENQPAYERRSQFTPPVQEVPQPYNEMQVVNPAQSNVSRISLNDGADGIYLEKNKYIHRNVD